MGISTESQSTRLHAGRSNQISDEQVLGQFIPLLYHYNMLQDEDRVGAFREAIELLVQPGMHVLELGGGTGILSSFAARQGAHVTCVEACARKFVRSNGLEAHIQVIQADATKFVPSKPVDVVICEMLHVGLLREKQAQVLSAFKRNYLSAFKAKLPVFIPEASILMAQPIEQSFDFFGYTAPVPLFQAPLLDQPRTSEFAELSPYASIHYEEIIPTSFAVRQTLTANHDGNLNALRFVTQNVLAINLEKQHAITWPNQCLVLPINRPFHVLQGQRIEMEFAYEAGGSIESLSDSINAEIAS
jgi:type I protein arginine methyltransferase